MVGLAYVELLRAANVRAASDDTSAEYGPLHGWWLVFLHLLKSVAILFVTAISQKSFRWIFVTVLYWWLVGRPSLSLPSCWYWSSSVPRYSHDRGYTFPCTPPDGTTSCHLHLHFHTDVLSSVPESSAKRNQCLIFINLGILPSVYVACPRLDMSLVSSSLCGYDTTITPQLTTGEAIYVKESC